MHGPQGVGTVVEVARVVACASVFLVIFTRTVLTGIPLEGGTSESVPLREFQLCTIITAATYYTLSFGIVLFARTETMLFVRARLFETVLVPALAVLLYAHWDEGLPEVQQSETWMVRMRLPLLLLAVVTEVLQTYHAPQAPAADLAAIGALGLGFAQAIARKYQQPFAGTAIPVMTLVCPPSFVGVLLYSAVKAQLWHVPANDIDTAICGVSDVKKEDCIKESENSDVDDGLFSDEGDNASDSSEQDDAQLALELSAEEVPRELRVDSPGKNAIAPIVAEQRLRSRKPVLYVS